METFTFHCLPVSHFLFISLEKETKPQSVWNIFFALFDFVPSTEKEVFITYNDHLCYYM